MQVFSKVKPLVALCIAAMFVSGAMAADGKCGGEMNSAKDAKEMKKPADAKCGGDKMPKDMMSEVLAFTQESALLLTGLTTPQVIRTAQMMDLS